MSEVGDLTGTIPGTGTVQNCAWIVPKRHYSGPENLSMVPAWHYSGLFDNRVQRLRIAGLTKYQTNSVWINREVGDVGGLH
ncbi:unnamed protein product [Ectocarpus sp. CCAP 1310/34]|nr:unnamed protein product [Ectocarpus sp. CCAP 1310/34]